MSDWDRESILRAEREAVSGLFSEAGRDELLEEIARLRAAAYPFVATLGGLDMAAPRGVVASSKLFPARIGEGADRDRLAVYDEVSGRHRYEPAAPEPLHLLDYAEAESIPVLNAPGKSPALDDAVTVLAVVWEGIGGGGPAGTIAMGDVRHLAECVRGNGDRKTSAASPGSETEGSRT